MSGLQFQWRVNHTSLNFHYYADSAWSPLFYDFAGNAHDSFPSDSTARGDAKLVCGNKQIVFHIACTRMHLLLLQQFCKLKHCNLQHLQ